MYDFVTQFAQQYIVLCAVKPWFLANIEVMRFWLDREEHGPVSCVVGSTRCGICGCCQGPPPRSRMTRQMTHAPEKMNVQVYEQKGGNIRYELTIQLTTYALGKAGTHINKQGRHCMKSCLAREYPGEMGHKNTSKFCLVLIPNLTKSLLS